MARCGIQRGNQPTSQRQPRLNSNQLPPGYSGPPPPSTPPLVGSVDHDEPDPDTSPTRLSQNANINSGPSSVWRDKQVKGFLVALLVINGLFAIGSLAALFLWVARTRGAKHGSLASRDPPVAHFAPLEKEYYDPYDHRSPSPGTPERSADR